MELAQVEKLAAVKDAMMAGLRVVSTALTLADLKDDMRVSCWAAPWAVKQSSLIGVRRIDRFSFLEMMN